LTRQSNQTACQQKGFFAARGLCPANRVKPGTQKFRAFAAPRYACASAKLAIHLQPHSPASFYPVSPEAGLLTDSFNVGATND
jgi:hypothetical protein